MKNQIEIFDRKAVRASRNRAAKNFPAHDFLHARAARELSLRLGDVRREFPLALQVGARGAFSSDKTQTVIRMDLAEDLLEGVFCVQADEEFLPFAPGTFDLIVSPLALHTVNDLPGALIQIKRALKPDGLFLAAMFGGETLFELRTCMMEAELSVRGGASPRIFPFADKQQMGALMQRAGFALPVVDSEILTVTYDHPYELMRELRGMGENNSIAERGRKPTGKGMMAAASEFYLKKFAEKDGRIPATFEIIFLSGWAPHESQQKPLRPGSAQKSLAEALGTAEAGTGDKATP